MVRAQLPRDGTRRDERVGPEALGSASAATSPSRRKGAGADAGASSTWWSARHHADPMPSARARSDVAQAGGLLRVDPEVGSSQMRDLRRTRQGAGEARGAAVATGEPAGPDVEAIVERDALREPRDGGLLLGGGRLPGETTR